MSRTRKMMFACAVLLGTLSAAHAQTNLGDLRDAPSGKFTPQDFEMLWATIDEVSRTRKTGTSKSWANDATGSGGTIKLLNVFTTGDGRDCRRLRIDNHARSLKGSSKQVVCADADRRGMAREATRVNRTAARSAKPPRPPTMRHASDRRRAVMKRRLH